MKIAKLPLNFSEMGEKEKQDLFEEVFGDVLAFMKEKHYELAGDVIGIKISMSLEEEKEEQYVLVSVPIA